MLNDNMDTTKSSLRNIMDHTVLYDYLRDLGSSRRYDCMPEAFRTLESNAYWNIVLLRKCENYGTASVFDFFRQMTSPDKLDRCSMRQNYARMSRAMVQYFVSYPDRVLTPAVASLMALAAFDEGFVRQNLQWSAISERRFLLFSTSEFEETYERRVRVEFDIADLTPCLELKLLTLPNVQIKKLERSRS